MLDTMQSLTALNSKKTITHLQEQPLLELRSPILYMHSRKPALDVQVTPDFMRVFQCRLSLCITCFYSRNSPDREVYVFPSFDNLQQLYLHLDCIQITEMGVSSNMCTCCKLNIVTMK